MDNELLRTYTPLLGDWWTSMTHPQLAGVVVRGTTNLAWLEGERFLLQRSRTDHPDFPDALIVIGPGEDGRPAAEYFDQRGVRRTYVPSFDGTTLRYERLAPGFAQRFAGTLRDDGATLEGLWQLDRGDGWADDLAITFRR